MKVFTIIAGFAMFVVAVPAFAYQLTVTEATQPYEIIPLQADPTIRQVYLGELNNFPVMYEFVSAEDFDISVQLSQPRRGSVEPTLFSLMIVRQDDRGGGVSEVARLSTSVSDWSLRKDSTYGLTFYETEPVEKSVGPGTYRVEVSTPENLGQYRISIGTEEPRLGYWETLSRVNTTQQFFGFSFMKMLTSSYIYYPLGILLLLFVLYRTWKWRKTIMYGT
jgi:hypothetical protein